MAKSTRKLDTKPRNYVAMAVAKRQGAGAHGKTEKVKRRDAKLALKKGQDFYQNERPISAFTAF